MVFLEKDRIADEIVEDLALNLHSLWRVRDLFPHTDLTSGRVFKSCLRLIARGGLGADLDAVIAQESRIWRREA
ncbi:hypothetical protein BVG79_01988 [Ketogulonicigenium robustum]|uniref:Transposase n=2 Tax=Ketogulonicigenium robustum TaxID=92947 RepID=A0A1W6P1W9_9RHOB|nr:hypothetical protein BVG79_01988 [Ketogulonicigenium robustum]